MIFLSGTVALICFAAGMQYFYSRSLIHSELKYSRALAESTAQDFEQLLREKIKTALTLANTPLLKQALATSNRVYGRLSGTARESLISQRDEKWKAAASENAPFV